MSPLIVLPLLAAAAFAAPAPGLLHGGLLAPQLAVAPAAVAYTTQVQVPVQKTVHYDVRNVVTGYSTNIIKPALPALAAPGLVAPALVGVPAQVAAPVQVVADAPAVAEPVPVPAAPAPEPVQEIPASDDTVVVESRSADAAPAPAPAPLAAAPVAAVAAAPAVAVAAAPAQLALAPAAAYATYAAPAVVAAPAVARVELQRDAPPFDQLVTKEQVLAPVRTHTQVTPQVTQIQPEVTVRRVIQEVPVATPVVAAPQLVRTVVAGPQVLSGHQLVSGQQVLAGHQLVSGQQVIAGPQLLSAQQVVAGPQLLSAQQFVGGQQVLPLAGNGKEIFSCREHLTFKGFNSGHEHMFVIYLI
ncbi:unnamed protein product [Allacma fusca]|uniref:Calphotin-like n=1 Tax=Allacma fusca TaxID=39272 RepID=A0A8J2LM08_9HEXA|nr:unnamed protein product [Allacma fusca]